MEKKNIDELILTLQREARRVSPGVKDSINGIGFRLLEQVRFGNKDTVFYTLLRCYTANKEKFPDPLVEAFKPENEKHFRILIFSFLAPILGAEQKTEGGE
ncbi:MAG: hypothetical protein ABIM42_07065 [candidate division WOR-3 bacterium]